MRIVDYTPKLSYKRAVLGVLIATLLISSLLAYYYKTPPVSYNLPLSSIGGLQGTLLVYKNGILVVNQPDILTQNFWVLLANWLNGDINSPNNSFTNGCQFAVATTDVATISTSSYGSIQYQGCSTQTTSTYTSQYPPNIVIGIGSGIITPSLTDTNLANKYATTGGIVSLSTNPIQVSITATFTASSSIQITEAGLYKEVISSMTQTSCSYPYICWTYIMIAHDSFSAISLNNGDTITITYQFNMPNCNPANNNTFSCNQLGLATLLAQGFSNSCSYAGNSYCIQQSSSNKYLMNVQAVQGILSATNPTPTTITSVNPITISVVNGKVNVVGSAGNSVSNAQNFGYNLCFGSGGCYSIATLVVGSNAGVNIVAGQPFGFQFSS